MLKKIKTLFVSLVSVIKRVLIYIVDNISYLSDVVTSCVKVIVALIHFWKPGKEKWVVIVENFGERLKSFFVTISDILDGE